MNAQSQPPSYLEETRSLLSTRGPLAWATTLDHKRLGVMYLVASGLALTVAVVLSAVAREDAASTVLAFLFLVPSLLGALGSFLLPLQLGQKSAALPRVSLLGFWLYVIGAGCTVVGIVATHGAKSEAAGFLPMLAGAIVIALSATLGSLNVLATTASAILRGLSSSRVSLFAWSLCATSVAAILGCLLFLGSVSFFALGRVGVPVGLFAGDFEARVLANPWAHLAPFSTIILAAAVGIVSDVFATFAGKKPAGFGFIATSVSALAWLGLSTWAFPIFVGGDADIDTELEFGLNTAFLGVPLAVVALSWLATLQRGRIALSAPMLWALSCLVQLSISAPAGLLLGLAPVGAYLRGTLFEVGYQHYVFVGVPLVGFVAGVHYAWPKITGRLYDERLSRVVFALVLIGIHATFLSEMARGLVPEWTALEPVSLYGSWVLALGIVGVLAVFSVSLFRGARAPENPWSATGLEWTVASPPPLENFLHDPLEGLESPPESSEPVQAVPEV